MEEISADDLAYLEAVEDILLDVLQRLGPNSEARFEFFQHLVRLALQALGQGERMSN